MIVEEVVGNIADIPPDERSAVHVERVVLDQASLRRRVQRVRTDHGRELGLRLTGSADLADGDILLREPGVLVVVSVEPTDVLVIAPGSVLEMGVVAHTLGNRHLPAQFLPPGVDAPGLEGHHGLMVIEYDHTAEHYLQEVGVRFIRQNRLMEVPFRHAEHSH